MARTREFDPAAVLEKASMLFWQKGFSETSMDDLVKHTGVSRYGLYGEFGNKRGLFVHALQCFFDRFMREQLLGLQDEAADLDDLLGYFERILEHACSEDSRMGCFLCNTAVELSSSDSEIAQVIDGMMLQLRQLFRQALGNALQSGNIRNLDIDDYAAYLIGVQMALQMMVRSGFAQQDMEKYLKIALAEIKRPE